MPDLGTRIRSHYDHAAPAIDIEALADRLELESLTVQPWRTRRVVAVALAAAIITLLAIGLPLWLVRAGEDPPVASIAPTPPTSTTLAGTSLPPTSAPNTDVSTDSLPTSTTITSSAWLTFAEPGGVPGGSIRQIVVAADGAVWAIGDGMARFVAGRWEPVTVPEGFVFDGWAPIGRSGAVKAAAAPDGAVWFAHDGGIHRYRDGDWRDYQPPGCDGEICKPTTIAVMGDGSVWTAASDHSYVYVPLEESWGFVAEDFTIVTDQGAALGGVNEFVVGGDGSLWYSTLDVVSRYDGSETIVTPYEFDRWPPPWTQVLAADAHGRAWIVVGYSQPDRYLMHVTDVSGARSDWPTYSLGDASAVANAPNGDVWVAVTAEPIDPWGGDYGPVNPVTEPGAYRLDATGWTHFTTDDGLAHNDVRAVAVAPDGTVWFGTSQGVSRFSPSVADSSGAPVGVAFQPEQGPGESRAADPSVALGDKPYTAYHPELNACVVEIDVTLVGSGSLTFTAHRVVEGELVEVLATGDVDRYGENPLALLSYDFPCDGAQTVEIRHELSLISADGDSLATTERISALTFE